MVSWDSASTQLCQHWTQSPVRGYCQPLVHENDQWEPDQPPTHKDNTTGKALAVKPPLEPHFVKDDQDQECTNTSSE